MTYLNGGYSIIKKSDALIYASVEKALTNGKPILFYEDDNTCYYIDSISKSGDDIVLTKGGKTITITDSNVVTESGEIQNHLYNNNIYIVGSDSSENSIYIYINIVTNKELNREDFENYLKTFTINKHLMVNGYSGDSSNVIVKIGYYDAYTATYSDDNDDTFTIESFSNFTTQIF